MSSQLKQNTTTIQDILETINSLPDAGSGGAAVLYIEQDLTDEQKAQARANIGAATVADVLAALPDGDEVAY